LVEHGKNFTFWEKTPQFYRLILAGLGRLRNLFEGFGIEKAPISVEKVPQEGEGGGERENPGPERPP
jgi:hypothetical protein